MFLSKYAIVAKSRKCPSIKIVYSMIMEGFAILEFENIPGRKENIECMRK